MDAFFAFLKFSCAAVICWSGYKVFNGAQPANTWMLVSSLAFCAVMFLHPAVLLFTPSKTDTDFSGMRGLFFSALWSSAAIAVLFISYYGFDDVQQLVQNTVQFERPFWQ